VTKVELFEAIRFDKFRRHKSIRRISRERSVHRRLVRQALRSSTPPARKVPVRKPTVLTDPLRAIIGAWLMADREAPRKQRHTGRRVFQRLRDEHDFKGAESTVRHFVARWRRENSLPRQAFVPLDHAPGAGAEVDWYEARVEFPSGTEMVQVFLMRSCYSGQEFHMAFPHQDQQAFLEAHAAAFSAFAGVFPTIRYDNLKTAVQRVLRGRRRLENQAFFRMRSHYLFESEFCRPGIEGAHEKGGVEGAVGRFRRQHLTPVPKAADYDDLNRMLRERTLADEARTIRGHRQSIAEDWETEQSLLLPLPKEPYDPTIPAFAKVDAKARIQVKANHYSVPVRFVGMTVEARLSAHRLRVSHGGREIACHDRQRGSGGERLELDHYIELLLRKPGALKRSRPLRQARDSGCWPEEFDRLWAELKLRYGESKGTKQLLTVLMLLRDHDADLVHVAVGLAVECGAYDAGAVQSLLRQLERGDSKTVPLKDLGALNRFDRQARDLLDYDQLLSSVLCFLSPLAILLAGA